jgi:putative solute:sodium symporter small subunit
MTHKPTSPSSESARDIPAGANRAPFWGRNIRLILLLLLLWAALTFLPAYFARDLLFTVLGWPFSYWMAAYGAPLAYLLIIVAYARIMNGRDRDLGTRE